MIAAAGLVLLALLVTLAIALVFDEARVKTALADAVAQRTERRLTIDGAARLQWLPSPGVLLEDLRLSEPGGAQPFARAERVQVSLAWLPLFARRIVVDHITIAGLGARIERTGDGRTNIDDLLALAQPRPEPAQSGGETSASRSGFELSIGGVAIDDAALELHDAITASRLDLLVDTLRTGQLTSGLPGRIEFDARVRGDKPKLDLRTTLSARYRIDLMERALRIDAIRWTAADERFAARLETDGVLVSRSAFETEPLRASLEAGRGEQALNATLTIAPIRSSDGVARSPNARLQISAQSGALRAESTIDAALEVVLADATTRLSRLDAQGTVARTAAGPPHRLRAEGNVGIDWARGRADAQLDARLDETPLDMRLVAHRLAPLTLGYEIRGGRLDLDRYLPPPVRKTATASAGPLGPGWLYHLPASGRLAFDWLRVRGIEFEDLSAGVNSGGGSLRITPFAASVFEGRLEGAFDVAQAGRVGGRGRIAGAQLGQALRVLTPRPLIEGRTDFDFSLESDASDAERLRRSLSGSARLLVREGVVNGVDLDALIRRVGALLGSAAPVDEGARADRRTPFGQLSASFAIRDGVARNDDLAMLTPALRLSGAGSVDLGRGTLDYLLKATIVENAAALGRLRGLSVPVRVSGPFERLGYQIDTAALLTDAARRQLERRGAEALEERAFDALKELFRR